MSQPLASTPLASAAATGVVRPLDPVVVTGTPAGPTPFGVPATSQAMRPPSPRMLSVSSLPNTGMMTAGIPRPIEPIVVSQSGMVLSSPPPPPRMSVAPLSRPSLSDVYGSPRGASPQPLSLSQQPQPLSLSQQPQPLSLSQPLSMGASQSFQQPQPLSMGASQSFQQPLSMGASQSFQQPQPLSMGASQPLSMGASQPLRLSQSPQALSAGSMGYSVPMPATGSPQGGLPSQSPYTSMPVPATGSPYGAAPMAATSLSSSPLATATAASSDLMEQSNVDQILLSAGLRPLHKIVNNEGGQHMVTYIKAETNRGQRVLVMIDTPGYTAVSPTDLKTIRQKPVTIIPYTTKMSSLEIAGQGVTGVAFDCKEGMCVVTRDEGDGGAPLETNLTIIKEHAAAVGVLDGSDLAYPVVSLSEVRAAPAEINKAIDRAVINLRKRAQDAAALRLNEMKAAIARLVGAFNSYTAAHNKYVTGLNESTNKLNTWATDYAKEVAATPSKLAVLSPAIAAVRQNAALRDRMYAGLDRVDQSIANEHVTIARLTDKLESNARELDGLASTVRGNLSPTAKVATAGVSSSPVSYVGMSSSTGSNTSPINRVLTTTV